MRRHRISRPILSGLETNDQRSRSLLALASKAEDVCALIYPAMWARDELVRVRGACVLTRPEHRARAPPSCFPHPFILLHHKRSFSELDDLIACHPLHCGTAMARCACSGRTITMAMLSISISLPISSQAPCVDVWVLGGALTLSHIELTRSLRFILPAFSCLHFLISCLSFCCCFL